MKVFISGPMSSYPNYNFQAFKETEGWLASLGHEVVSMRRIVMEEMGGDTTKSHKEYMQKALQHLPYCDAIYLMDGWHTSDGAKCEVAVALTLNLAFLNGLKPPQEVTISRRD